MKRISTLIFVIVFTNLFSIAQQNLTYGVKAGVNVSYTLGHEWDYHLGMNIQAEEIWGRGSSVGYFLGGYFRYDFSSMFGFGSELNFMSKTYSITYWLRRNYNNTYRYFDDDAFVIELPVLFYFSPWNFISFIVGPSVNFISTDREGIANIELCAGAGVQLNITQKIHISTRYNWGLTNLFDDDPIGWLGLEPYLYSNGFNVAVGYNF